MALIHSPFFTCLSYRIKKRKKATTFKLFKLVKHTQKHAVTTEDKILIRHYDWIRVLNKRICHQTNLPEPCGLHHFGKFVTKTV